MYFAADPEADDLMNKDNDREQHLNEDKPSEREKQHSSFEPDLDYDYVYDQDLSCMVYNGPDFEVGELELRLFNAGNRQRSQMTLGINI
jgi:hypothetical protein